MTNTIECPECATVQPPGPMCSNANCNATIPLHVWPPVKVRVERKRSRDGARQRDEGIARASQGSLKEWREAAREAVRRVAANASSLTTDDVWDELDRVGMSDVREPRAMGAVMLSMVKAGVIASTDRTRLSMRPECHRRPVRVWRVL